MPRVRRTCCASSLTFCSLTIVLRLFPCPVFLDTVFPDPVFPDPASQACHPFPPPANQSVLNHCSNGCASPDIGAFAYITGLRLAAQFAEIVGNTTDASFFGRVANLAAAQFQSQFYHADSATYVGGKLID